LVFLMGSVMALISLVLARNVPMRPCEGYEVEWGRVKSSRNSLV